MAAVSASVRQRASPSVERAFLRLTFWQTLLSLVGVFVGAVALYAALTESQRRATSRPPQTVWPYLQSGDERSCRATEEAHFELLFDQRRRRTGAHAKSLLLEVDDRGRAPLAGPRGSLQLPVTPVTLVTKS
jgi:hypothetical protein